MSFMIRPRMRKIDGLYGKALLASVRERDNVSDELSIGDLLRRFAEADPSRNKSATQWLVRCYLAKGFRLEDLSKAHDTLVAFARHRKQLPVAERDLGRYRTLAGVWKSVRPFAMAENAEPATGREARRQERERARAESHILFEGEDGFTVAVPMTEFASCWWGRGTRWCTAAEKDNAFSRYHVNGPLIVILLPDGRQKEKKLQMFVSKNDFQFMDEDDDKVSSSLIEQWWRHLEPIIRWAVGQNGLALHRVPETLRDHGLCLEAIRQSGHALPYVPKYLQDRKMCLEAVRQAGALYFVPENLHDSEMCLEAVRQNGGALQFVPEYLRDSEMCIEAVRQDGVALQFVPQSLRNREICLEAVTQNGRALEHVPIGLRDGEMCLRAVKQDGYPLHLVPEDLRGSEKCIGAVKQDGRALQFTPQNLRHESQELAVVAIQREERWQVEILDDLKSNFAAALEGPFASGNQLAF